MRAFVAVVPPEEALAPLAEALPALRERWPSLGWIPPERWHLTVCFLGEVSIETVEALSTSLSTVAGATAPIAAAMGEGGSFPGGRRVRVLWAAVDGGPALVDLAGRVTAAASAAGVPVERRPWSAHLTLARVRREPPEDASELRSRLGAARGRAFTIDRLVVFRSHLGPKPRYDEVASFRLGAGAPIEKP